MDVGESKTRPTPTKSSAGRRSKPSLPAITATDAADAPSPCSSIDQDDGTDDTEEPAPHTQHVRRRQNRVGKRHRDKLSAGFERLEVTLGLGDAESRGDGLGGGDQDGLPDAEEQSRRRKRRRPINKAKILDLTCERVQVLLQEWETVKAEREALRKARVLEGW
ncbi:hypothetical protein C8A01DRAFT_18721 [Parachaetomium inaequale]|uniref:Uncharacterized protein n=1 Tax=Parachaetomium inaequale TaxID=2588326 RepID=A0AAN6SP73_9PEZI|nr:hypothetical protein C8A01DRAFT_18721 [Parachaetomium inaequale]